MDALEWLTLQEDKVLKFSTACRAVPLLAPWLALALAAAPEGLLAPPALAAAAHPVELVAATTALTLLFLDQALPWRWLGAELLALAAIAAGHPDGVSAFFIGAAALLQCALLHRASLRAFATPLPAFALVALDAQLLLYLALCKGVLPWSRLPLSGIGWLAPLPRGFSALDLLPLALLAFLALWGQRAQRRLKSSPATAF